MKTNSIKEENFLAFLQKNKEDKNFPAFQMKINNNTTRFRAHKNFEENKKLKTKEKILNSLKLEFYFNENVVNNIFQLQKQTLETKLDRIERILGFQIYKFIHDLCEYTKINLQISEIKKIPTPETLVKSLNLSTNTHLSTEPNKKKDQKIPISSKPTFFSDESKEKYFKNLNKKTRKAEIHEFLNKVYENSLLIYNKLSKNDEKNPKKFKPVLFHSNSMEFQTKKSLKDEILSPRTPQRKNKKVSFHGEVTIQVFSPHRTDCVTTVKKEEYKERKRKAINFMDFMQKQENDNEVRKNDGAKNLLKFINKNNLGMMENMNYLQNNFENKANSEHKTNMENRTNIENRVNTTNIEENRTKIEKNRANIEENRTTFQKLANNGRRGKIS